MCVTRHPGGGGEKEGGEGLSDTLARFPFSRHTCWRTVSEI